MSVEFRPHWWDTATTVRIETAAGESFIVAGTDVTWISDIGVSIESDGVFLPWHAIRSISREKDHER